MAKYIYYTTFSCFTLTTTPKKKCIFDYDSAVASCQRDTQGGSKIFHHENRSVLPRWFVDTASGLPIPMYTDVAIKGKDTMCQILNQDYGFGRFTPICYDYAQLVSYIENPSMEPYGLDTVLWDGMYAITIGTCSGYPPVQCEENVTTLPTDELLAVSDASGASSRPSVIGDEWWFGMAWTALISVGTFFAGQEFLSL